jgi:hypothetical protein
MPGQHPQARYTASPTAVEPETAPDSPRDNLLLRSWTGDLSCGAAHQDSPMRASPPAATEWECFVQADVERRHQRELDRSSVTGARQV